MAFFQRHEVSITTDASGDGTGYTPVVNGCIQSVRYVKDATTPYADGVDVDVTLETTGATVLDDDNVNASATYAPRQATHDTSGNAALYASGGENVNAPIAVAGERIKIVVANGGNAKTGTFHIVVGG